MIFTVAFHVWERIDIFGNEFRAWGDRLNGISGVALTIYLWDLELNQGIQPF